MEASGHYYTVYFTSLAVGFSEDVAFNQASLAQMPDQVGWLDASHMHILQCINGSEANLSGNTQMVAHDWRFLIEYALHSLPAKNSANTNSEFQQRITLNMLSRESPVSAKFGLLLHRLGDTYAHSIMGDEKKMYTVSPSGDREDCVKIFDSTGHLRHGHFPDYPVIRKDKYFDYLRVLHLLLFNKAKSPSGKAYCRSNRSMEYPQLSGIFQHILRDFFGKVNMALYFEHSPDKAITAFIAEIRAACKREFTIEMKPYAPEKEELMTLGKFLSTHKKLGEAGINERTIINAINSISKGINAMKP